MRFSVVVPTYNRAALLAKCLAALADQSYRSYEVIVVDDGSDDETPSVVKRIPVARYLRQDNKGPAAARNLGIANARGELIAFTDDDCVVPSDWLEQLEGGYIRHPEAAGVGGYLEPPEELLTSNIFAQYERYVTHNVYGAGPHEVVGGFECPAGGTNNMSYRRRVLEEVGGFDESFPFAAGEDADLKWRICRQGHRLVYVPVKATHFLAYDWRAFARQSITRGKGAARFEGKWASRPGRVRIAGRLARRFLVFFYDIATMESKRMAAIKFLGGVYDCLGQFAVGDFRRL